jgi:uncharacterized protein with HEPN domain
MKDDGLYLIHILECIERVERYTADGGDAFIDDTRTQDAVMRNLQLLAESTQRLSDELRQKYPGIEWRNIAAFRNVAVHDYLGIDLKQVWDIVADDLPVLKRQIEAAVKDLGISTTSA